MEVLNQSSIAKVGKIAFLDENEGVILIASEELVKKDEGYLRKILEEFRSRVTERCDGMELELGTCLKGLLYKSHAYAQSIRIIQ